MQTKPAAVRPRRSLFCEIFQKIGFPAVSRHSGTIFGLSAPKLVEINRFGAILRYFSKYFRKLPKIVKNNMQKRPHQQNGGALRAPPFLPAFFCILFFTIWGYFRKYFEKIVKKSENLASFMLDRPTQEIFSYF